MLECKEKHVAVTMRASCRAAHVLAGYGDQMQDQHSRHCAVQIWPAFSMVGNQQGKQVACGGAGWMRVSWLLPASTVQCTSGSAVAHYN